MIVSEKEFWGGEDYWLCFMINIFAHFDCLTLPSIILIKKYRLLLQSFFLTVYTQAFLYWNSCLSTASKSPQILLPLEHSLPWILTSLSYSFFFFFFRSTPAAYGGSQARGQIWAAVASLHHSHSSVGFKLHLQPVLQLTITPDP